MSGVKIWDAAPVEAKDDIRIPCQTSASSTTPNNVSIGEINKKVNAKLTELDVNRTSTTTAMGYKVLNPNLTFAEQVTEANTIYEIRDEFSLTANVELKENSILKFVGGKLKGGTLAAKDSKIKLNTSSIQIFDNVKFLSNIECDGLLLEWFGAKGNGITDDTNAWLQARSILAKFGGKVKLLNKTYTIAPIDLVELTNITIEGTPSSLNPYKIVSSIKINAEGGVGIRCVEDYPANTIPNKYAKGIYLKDFYLDCSNLVTKGINCNASITIDNVEVRNCNGDGIVIEARTYPVYIRNTKVLFCKGNGLKVEACYSTIYNINNLDINGCDGYGAIIEGGAYSSIKGLIMQKCKRGGLKIKERSNDEFTHQHFLGNLRFEEAYTEECGTLTEDDPNYDGNYHLLVQGLNNKEQSYIGKLSNILFINCGFIGKGKVEGTNDCLFVGGKHSQIEMLDDNNLPYRAGSFIFRQIQLKNLYGTPITSFHVEETNINLFKVKQADGASNIIITNQISRFTILNKSIHIQAQIDYTNNKINGESFITFYLNKPYGLYNGFNGMTLLGSGHITYKVDELQEGVSKEVTKTAHIYPFMESYSNEIYLGVSDLSWNNSRLKLYGKSGKIRLDITAPLLNADS